MSLQDKQHITEVLSSYARAVDRKDFEAVRKCYFADAIDNHGGYVGNVDGLIEDMKQRHQTIDSSMHFVTNVLIELDGDAAQVESYCLCFLRQKPSAESFTHSLATVKCRYVDRFERRDDRWRIADRIVVFDESTNTEIRNLLSPDWVQSQRSQNDPVYTRLP